MCASNTIFVASHDTDRLLVLLPAMRTDEEMLRCGSRGETSTGEVKIRERLTQEEICTSNETFSFALSTHNENDVNRLANLKFISWQMKPKEDQNIACVNSAPSISLFITKCRNIGALSPPVKKAVHRRGEHVSPTKGVLFVTYH